MARTKKPAGPPPDKPDKPPGKPPGKKKGKYTFTNVNSDHTIHVTFVRAGDKP